MSVTKYNLLTTVAFKHDYYNLSNNNCRDISFAPLMQSQQLMKNYQIVLRPIHSGFELYYITEEGQNSLMQELEGYIQLSFALSINNPYFLNFTELPFKSYSNKKFYFSNLYEHEEEDSKINIAQAKSGFVSGKDLFEVKPKVFEIPIEIKDGTVKIQVLNDRLETVIEETISIEEDINNGTVKIQVLNDRLEIVTEETYPTENTPQKHRINLSEYVNGPYWLIQNEQETDIEIVVDEEEAIGINAETMISEEVQPFLALDGALQATSGLLEIYIGNTGNTGSHILKDGIITPETYSITFHRRATHWRYLLILNQPPKYENFQIDGGDPDEFTLAPMSASLKLSNGSIARPMTSEEEAIPMKEGQNKKLKLKMTKIDPAVVRNLKKTRASEEEAIPIKEGQDKNLMFKTTKIGIVGERKLKFLSINLPVPDIKNVKPVSAGDETYKVYSDMYVQL